ncbi:DUF6297 family protein [Nonomuraea longicatena]|uniref:ABC-2 type transport system permease protein n=1 Tax=Nonomuraea longicatena TaxID=83682 RepID=A0ABP4A2I5_9ACTN
MSALTQVRALTRRGGPDFSDRYTVLATLLVGAAILGRPVSEAFGDLARPIDPAQAGAGLALVLLALAGALTLARTLGPVTLSAADAAWVLLSPLDRRGVLGGTARVLLALGVAVGVVLGFGLLIALGAPDQLTWRLIGALVVGVSAGVGGMALAVLGQESQPWDVALRAVIGLLMVLAVAAALGGLATYLVSAPSALLAVPVVTALLLVRRAHAALTRIPARALLDASSRTASVARATSAMDPSVLSWIAEDNHWRARTLASKRWPSLPAPLAVAWQDWRRLGRRPGRLALIAVSVALPVLAARAGADVSVWLLAGALAAASTVVTGARRDADDAALARLLGTSRRATLAARAVLPALVGGVWLAVAGAISGTAAAWFAPVAAPALAAAALRMARRPPADHTMPILDTPMGSIPTGPAIWAMKGPDLAVLACLPAIVALVVRPEGLALFVAAQAVTGAAALGGYLALFRGR